MELDVTCNRDVKNFRINGSSLQCAGFFLLLSCLSVLDWNGPSTCYNVDFTENIISSFVAKSIK